jgi:hypothetical protein
MNETTTTDTPDLARRQLGLGLLGLAGALAATRADALPAGAARDFVRANRILEPYGIAVRGEDLLKEDYLTVDIVPAPSTLYDAVVSLPGAAGGIVPCIKTSHFGGHHARFTHFDETGREAASETLIAPESESFTHYHPAAPGEIIPCIRTTIEGHARAVHELLDAAGGGAPAITTTTEMKEGGVLGATVMTVHAVASNLAIVVGQRTYRLQDGALVEEPRGAA